MDCKETGVTGPVGYGLADTKGSVGTVGAPDTVETWRPQAPGAVGKAEPGGAIGRGWPFMTYCIGR